MTMRITSKEIARICGVSRGTVDRALNGKPGINAGTRETILRTAAENGYVPDYIGRSLVKGRTFTIGVIVFDLNNPYFSQLLNAVEIKARAAGFAVVIMLSEGSVDHELAAVRNLHERRVDGLIIHPVGFGPAYEEAVRQTQCPAVIIGNRLSDQFDFISIDNQAAAAEAARTIIARGYRRILYVAPPLRKAGSVNIAAQSERHSGFLASISAGRLPYRVIAEPDYLEILKTELAQTDPEQPTAIFCGSDVYALEVMNLLRSLPQVPDQSVGLMGFDQIDILKYIMPQLATVGNPIAEIGRQAVDRLIRRMNDPDLKPQNLIMPHQIIAGETLPICR